MSGTERQIQFFWKIIFAMFLWRALQSEIIPDRCVVAGCSNIADPKKGIALHKIPFYSDD